MNTPLGAAYDQAYFEKWYREKPHRVSTPATAARKARLAVSMAEYYLDRRVRTALDIGCGEGQWQPLLARLGIRYTGVDPSPYAIRRFGKRRNLHLGSLGHLPPLAKSYDLIICSDALYYVPDDELIMGLHVLSAKLAGIAFLEAYPEGTPLDGDTAGMIPRSAAFYRRVFRSAGLISCGSHCYAGPALAARVTGLERGCSA